ncbi:MAG TPA: dihydrofolate reductase [Erysipelotrichaceae bacterium]|nr:dihydrofolate reductase [Erysipelotrichaceae bacterium]
MICCIVAMDDQGGIGLNGTLPWHIKEDLMHFKNTTLHHTILMGKKTFLSIGRALPKRRNLVVTHHPELLQDMQDLEIIEDLQTFLETHACTEELVYVIGGANVYAQALPYAKYLAISHIKGIYTCDTFFPHFDENDYTIIKTEEFEAFDFKLYEKKQ